MYSSVKIQDSIATRLLTVVFSIYFMITLSVTIGHMFAEYLSAKEEILQELLLYEQIFNEGIGGALWNVDEDQLLRVLQGMHKIPTLIGIKVISDTMEGWGVGIVQNPQGDFVRIDQLKQETPVKEKGIFNQYFFHEFDVYFESHLERVEVGTVFLYVSENMVLNKVKYGFVFIIVNSLVKTLSLWFIFLWVSRLLLNRPLSILTKATEKIDLETLENQTIDVRTKGRNELKILEETFNAMIQKLLLARDRSTSLREFNSRIADFQEIVPMLESAFFAIVPNEKITNAALFYDWQENEFSQKVVIHQQPEFVAVPPILEFIQSMFGENSEEMVVINNIQVDQAAYSFYHEYADENILGSHWIFIKIKDLNPHLIILFRSMTEAPFDSTDLEYCHSMIEAIHVAQHNIASILQNARIQTELQTARNIQFSFLPKEIPQIHGFDLAVEFHPAKEVSGDYYDFIQINEFLTGIVIADVSGKGLPAALYVNIARALLRDKSKQFETPQEVLSALNQSLQFELGETGRFLTMTYVLIDARENMIHYVCAGHEPMVLLSTSQKRYDLLKPKGYPLSSIHADLFDHRIQQESYQMQPGDLIFMYTDGVTDVTNEANEMFGEEALYEMVERLSDQTPQQLTQQICDHLNQFRKDVPQTDDITIIALRKQ